MNSQPSPQNERQRLQRALIFGASLSILGIVLFLVLYALMSSVESAPRLFLSLCVPPAIIALILGVYVLSRSNR